MPEKPRTILLAINEQIKKLNQPPPPTFSPKTGEVKKPETYTAPVSPVVILPPIK